MTDRSSTFGRRGVLKAGAAGFATLGVLAIPSLASAKEHIMTQL